MGWNRVVIEYAEDREPSAVYASPERVHKVTASRQSLGR
jgi:hypothetical protein